MDKSITEIIEEVKSKMCDKFCKYPDQPIPKEDGRLDVLR